jgi:hypothetical protein
MILFKITSCPDKSQIGIFQHESNEMVLGNAAADMIIDDPGIAPSQVGITFKKGQFSVANLFPKITVKLNGVPLTGKPQPIKSNDSIAMGNTTIFFTQINDKQLSPPPIYTNEATQKRFNNPNSTERAILQALEYLAGDGSPPKKS